MEIGNSEGLIFFVLMKEKTLRNQNIEIKEKNISTFSTEGR